MHAKPLQRSKMNVYLFVQVYRVFLWILLRKQKPVIFLGSPVSYIGGPNWQILAQQVLKNKVLSHRFLLYRVYER